MTASLSGYPSGPIDAAGGAVEREAAVLVGEPVHADLPRAARTRDAGRFVYVIMTCSRAAASHALNPRVLVAVHAGWRGCGEHLLKVVVDGRPRR